MYIRLPYSVVRGYGLCVPLQRECDRSAPLQKGSWPLPFLQNGRALTQDVRGSFIDPQVLGSASDVGVPLLSATASSSVLKSDLSRVLRILTFTLPPAVSGSLLSLHVYRCSPSTTC